MAEDEPTVPVKFFTARQRASEARLADRLRYEHSRSVQALLGLEPTAERLYAVADAARLFAETSADQQRRPEDPSVACKAGCSSCCYQPVRIVAPEAFRIAQFMTQEMTEPARGRMAERLHSLDRVTRGGALGRQPPRACAFLEEDRCSIYPVRPLACAGFSSYDVEDCRRGRDSGFRPGEVMQEKASLLSHYAAQQGLRDGLSAGLPAADAAWLELTAAVVDTLAHPDAATAWLAGEPVLARAHLNEGS